MRRTPRRPRSPVARALPRSSSHPVHASASPKGCLTARRRRTEVPAVVVVRHVRTGCPPWFGERSSPHLAAATSTRVWGIDVNRSVVRLGWYRFRATFGRRWVSYFGIAILVGLL